ncbi:MAG TPA: CDP-alcohol phosphatidyltransferase family protein [Ktedonobacteraceae bacterium]|nr:CDP-alcohol phosphatidyltransferase family protein [Ktedonobacteraceae bacterium]
MKQLRKKIGSIYSDDEELVLGPWQRIRQGFLGPIAYILSRLGIKPDTLSYTSVVFGIAFCLLAPFQFTVAFWLLIASIICDGLDGVEARLTKTNTASGSFTDMFCDQLVVAFSVAGMAWKNLIHPVLAVLFVYVYTALVIFLMLHRMLQVSSHWIVRPSRMLLYAAIALYFFFRIDVLNYLLLIYLLALPLLVLSFWRLKRAL